MKIITNIDIHTFKGTHIDMNTLYIGLQYELAYVHIHSHKSDTSV